jgi:homogentisate 1,2-dioxygenase/fumarylacetoacetase-like protein
MRTMTTAGDVHTQTGMAAHVFQVTRNMEDDYFMNADGELLIVPQAGGLDIATELVRIGAGPGDIAVIPRGMKFKAGLQDGPSRGYVCENYGARFSLPARGPIGANCLANPRDFKTPVASFEEKETACRLTLKWCGGFHVSEIGHSPLDVVAWHGNYTPYKYDLRTFAPVGAILFDHPDPSIFTVLTAPSGEAGTANVDFVIFPVLTMSTLSRRNSPRVLASSNRSRPRPSRRSRSPRAGSAPLGTAHACIFPYSLASMASRSGRADAGTGMNFDFPALIAHAARTRPLGAGTIVGSGTVSNKGADGGPGRPVGEGGVGYSCLAEARMVETIRDGATKTPFMRFGDTVRIEMKNPGGQSIFGAIEQTVEPYARPPA